MRFLRNNLIAALAGLAVVLGAANAQAQQLKLLPSDTELILTVNLQQILKSEILKSNKALVDTLKEKLAGQLEDKGVAKYLQKADFDLFRDLKSVTLGIPGGARPPQEAFIILDGNFNTEKIEAAVAEADKETGGGALKTVRIAGIKAYEVAPKDEKTIYIGVLNKKTLIVAPSKADFSEAVGRLNGTKEPSIKAEIKNLLDTVNAKQSLSVVATGTLLAKLAENAPQANDQAKAAAGFLQKLDGASVAITMDRNIDFQVGVTTPDNKTATDFANKANLFITVGKASVADKAKNDEKAAVALEVLNTMRASAQGNNLVVRGQVTFEALSKLLQNLPIPGN